MIGEAPGEQEQQEGEPFVGGSGRILRGLRVLDPRTGLYKRYGGLIGEAGLRDAEISYINTIQCRPLNNVYPTDPKAKIYISREEGDAAVKHCLNRHVFPVLRSRTWARIDLIGGKALKYLGEKNEGVEGWRGSPICVPTIDAHRANAMATIHPAALMRDQSMMPAVVNDLKKSLIQPPEKYILHPTLEQVKEFNAKIFAFDIETNYPRSRDITMVGLSATVFEVLVVPWAGSYIAELKRIFNNANICIGHNCIQFDIPYLAEYGVKISDNCLVYDTMLMQHLVQPDLPHDLTFVGSIFTSKPTWEFNRHIDEQLYNARDVDVTLQAFNQLNPLLRMQNLNKLYNFIQVPLARICKLMRDTGVAIDATRINSIRDKLALEICEWDAQLPDTLRKQIVKIRRRQVVPPGTLSPLVIGKKGKPLKRKLIKHIFVEEEKQVFPWRSPMKIAEYLYDICKIPVERDLKTEAISTGKIALAKISRRLQNRTYKVEQVAEVHKAVTAVQKLRSLDELQGNFAQEEYISIKRQHTNFNVHGTYTGRLSSSNPNLQNVPQSARYIYVPSYPGWSFLSVDYSGIENRITAHLAGDLTRLARFDSRPGFSEHKYATSLFFDVLYEDVIKDNDRTAPYGRSKAIVHGADRGEGARKIALLNDIPEAEVRPLLMKWKADIAATIKWQVQIADQAAKQGYLTNPFGRKAWFWGNRLYTQSISFMPQSTAADVIYHSMIGIMFERINWPLEKVQQVVSIYEALPNPARLLLQVHDELLLEMPNDLIPEVARILRRVMTQPWKELGGLVLPVEIKVGQSWADAEMESWKGE